MTHPRVSVVLPTRNRARTIGAAIDSVLNQDETDLELIVVDDGSTDATSEVVSERRDPRLRYAPQPVARGANAARNVGIALGRTPFIAFQDSDDVWLPGKLRRQLRLLDDPEVVLVYTALERSGPAGSTRVPPLAGAPSGWLRAQLLTGNFISTQTAVIRRTALDAVGGFDESLPRLQDWELWLRLAGVGPFAGIDEMLVRAEDSPDSITRNAPAYFEALAIVVNKHSDLLATAPSALANHRYTLAVGAFKDHRVNDALTHLALGLRPDPRPGLSVYLQRVIRRWR